ncbi:uncharacterized protein VNE69_02108 [Vairimorpha necatrix]|uniref:Uncharacterized protein n=1 Tax=Vairimorpha necatrix TaxID=6039 RepID=A0AAX4J9K6_9MICR
MLLFILLIKSTEYNLSTRETQSQIQQNNQVTEIYVNDLEKILAEPYEEIESMDIEYLDDLEMWLSGNVYLESEKNFSTGNQSQMIFDDEKTLQIKENLNKKLIDMNTKYIDFLRKKQKKIDEIISKPSNVKLNLEEKKTINKKKIAYNIIFNKYRKICKNRISLLKIKILEIKMLDKTIILNALNFIEKFNKFFVSENRYQNIKPAPLKFLDRCKIDIWKVETLINLNFVPDLIETIKYYYENIKKHDVETINQIIEDLEAINIEYYNFCDNKNLIISSNNEIIDIINKKQKIKKAPKNITR